MSTRALGASPMRRQIVRLLWRDPGISARGVARAVDLDESTAAYHLHRLEREGEIIVERVGRIAAHYPSGWGDATARKYAALSAESRAVLAVLRDELTPARPVDVARRAELPVGVARYALLTAVRLGLARRVTLGRYEVVA